MNCDLCVYRIALPGFAHRVAPPAAAARPPARSRAPPWRLTSPTSPMQPERPDEPRPGPPRRRRAGAGLVDLAVNVRAGTPPTLARRAASRSHAAALAAYPDAAAARAAAAAGTGAPGAGAGRRRARPRRSCCSRGPCAPAAPVVVHPQFTEPEAALRAAGHAVERRGPRRRVPLDPAAVPADADLVVVGQPHQPDLGAAPGGHDLAALARPGRMLVVDEAFADTRARRAGEPGRADATCPGLVVLRSLTKTWGLAGLRVGYVLAAPADEQVLARPRRPGRCPLPRWPPS